MSPDRILRIALWLSVPFNVFGATLFAFPGSALGQFAGLPAESVPLFYRATLAFFVLMFGGLYTWMALQPRIPRAMVAFTALGKGGVFLLVLAFTIIELAPARALLPALGDAMFAALFAWWLSRTHSAA